MADNSNFNPDLEKILEGNPGEGRISRYSLVSATAKLAREMVDDAINEREGAEDVSTQKPVSLALNKIMEGDYKIIVPDEIKNL
ncbi:MAG: DNA-directed RNA polymerase subunit omega [Clostridia bacterium]|jgi:DNA-directed RNA polymerase subunit K/omega|nr:DNA-directed RNA polymerase subunit omega [Clostridia bacterium]